MELSSFLVLVGAFALLIPLAILFWLTRSQTGPFHVSIVRVGTIPARYRLAYADNAVEIHKRDVELTVHIGNTSRESVTIGSYFFKFEHTGAPLRSSGTFPPELMEPLQVQPGKGYYVQVPIGDLYALAEMGLTKSNFRICFRDTSGHTQSDAFRLRV